MIIEKHFFFNYTNMTRVVFEDEGVKFIRVTKVNMTLFKPRMEFSTIIIGRKNVKKESVSEIAGLFHCKEKTDVCRG